MSRRGRSGPAISLFSFQDIITSVTAIVMVITLLLAVDLVQRKRSSASDSSSGMASELAQRLADIEAQLATLRNATSTTDDLVREVAATSPADLRNEISQREAITAQLERDRQRLQQTKQDLASLENVASAERFDVEPLLQQKELTDRATAEMERQAQQERQENRPVFTLPTGFQKEGWLAVIESDRIVVAPLGRPEKPVKFEASGVAFFRKTAADLFGNWIDRENLKNAYFLLLIRPTATDTFDAVEDELLQRSVSYGFDLIANDATILHPEKGAAP